ncbi:uncharacterized protein PFL1_03298 [Pseudozyma flocculosa PF-1]|uniref:NAD(P)-binding protein n=1 Tax=Pseudozyma flocculosa PF-1 TaxID=1277687 RepID=A0A061H8U2_9BASI|nr:uncharacterized protein PFL1_03298 [Pseudozyma flocculosa PF-1]EPQ29008.1 hypothetical protein PFL1_03298 [Pseudozyma flocculosa PF-1]
MSSSADRARNRIELLVPNLTPHGAVAPLGHDACHGPMTSEHIVIVLGVGPGLGLSIARTFASRGYTVAILSRSKARLDAWAAELDQASKQVEASSGGAAAFECDALDPVSIRTAVANVRSHWPERRIGTAIYNASIRVRSGFMDLDGEKVKQSVDGSITGGFAFAQAALESMLEHGRGGSLIFTGATSSIRGRENFAAFAAAKSGLRAMCQSMAKEFGPRNIHVAHVIVDGLIESQQALDFFGMPKGSRFPDGGVLYPPQMAKTWLFLAQQHPGSWTHELDLRPAKEHF